MITLMEKLPTKKIIFMIILLFIPLYIFYLGTPSLWDEDESVYTEISRQMMVRNDLIGTYFNDEPRYDKPPLMFWINIFFYKIFGMNEFTSRLGSTIFGFLNLILVFLFGKKLFNKRSGILAALMLGTGFLFFVETQLALIDTALTFFIGLTLYLFYLGFMEGKSIFLLWMGIPLGLGILTKGPVALLLTGAIGFTLWIFQTIRAKITWQALFNWKLLIGFGIAAMICLPWYIAMWSRYGMDFIQSHFGYHMIDRFTKPLEGHGGEWYFYFYYVIFLFIGFMPWSAYIPGSLKTMIQQWSDPKHFFLLCWALLSFAFFTIAQTKLPGYTLPLFLPIALMMGYWWDQLLANNSQIRSNPWWGIILQFIIVLGFTLLIAFNQNQLPNGYGGIAGVLFLLPISLMIGILVILIWRRRNHSYEPFFKVTFFTFYLIWALFLMLLVPAAEKNKPVKYLSVELKKYLKPQDQIISYTPAIFSSPFYTQHKVFYVTDNQSFMEYYLQKSRIFAIASDETLKYLSEQQITYYQLSHHRSGYYLISNQPVK